MDLQTLATVIGVVVGLVTIIVVGVTAIRHLASIDTRTQIMQVSVSNLQNRFDEVRAEVRREIEELRVEFKSDAKHQWEKLSSHDVEIAKLIKSSK